jgi:hypothetical protein
MNQAAHNAVEKLWTLTVKTRALCPHADDSAVGLSGYISPPWYLDRGAIYFVNLAQPLTIADVHELREIGAFVNRSFLISLAALLEEHGVVPYRADPDRSKNGGDHVQLVKWLRNRFAHGHWEYDASDPKHVETRQLLETLFPDACRKDPGFAVPIDDVLEPLKDGALSYIRATT